MARKARMAMLPGSAMPHAMQTMQTLTTQYHHALTHQLRLDPHTFRLAQGRVPLGATSESLWSLMDTVPDAAISQVWSAGRYNAFSANVGLLLSRLQSPAKQAFRQALGEREASWHSHLQAYPPHTLSAYLITFRAWAETHMPAEQVSTLRGLYQLVMADPIGRAQQMWRASGGGNAPKAHRLTIELADDLIALSPGGCLTLDTLAASGASASPGGAAIGHAGSLFGEAQGHTERLSAELLQGGLLLELAFEHVAVLPTAPLQSGSIMTETGLHPAWYAPDALALASTQPDTPHWDSFFGPAGTLRHASRALVVVDGIRLTLRSRTPVAQQDQAAVLAAFETGCFPFFGRAGDSGWQHQATFDDAGCIVVRRHCPVGHPHVLGVLAAPIDHALAMPTWTETRRRLRTEVLARAPAVMGAHELDPSTAMVSTSWTQQALQGLRRLGLKPEVMQLIAGYVNAWARHSAKGWALHAPHQYVSAHPAYTATAAVVAVSGGHRTVNVTRFG